MIAGLTTYIRIGSIEVHRAPQVRIMSERRKPLTRMEISLPDPTGNVFRAVDDRAQVSVIIGYRGQEPALWEGTLKDKSVCRNKDQLVLKVIGPERPLAETTITQSFLEETPEAIVQYAIKQAGFTPGRIDATGIVIPRFVASNIPVWQVARQCEHTCKKAFGLDMRPWAMWRGKDGKINWCPGDEEADIPVIKSSENLIRHSPGDTQSELSRVETFMLPHLMHSMVFRLIDEKRSVEEDFKALKVEHLLLESRTRTFISYGESYERY